MNGESPRVADKLISVGDGEPLESATVFAPLKNRIDKIWQDAYCCPFVD